MAQAVGLDRFVVPPSADKVLRSADRMGQRDAFDARECGRLGALHAGGNIRLGRSPGVGNGDHGVVGYGSGANGAGDRGDIGCAREGQGLQPPGGDAA